MLRIIRIGIQVFILFLVYFAGVSIQNIFKLTIPGSVIGLILMFLLLISGLFKEDYIKIGASFMIRHLVLFFIPATVGIMKYYELFKGKGMLLVVITIFSTMMVMTLSGFVSQKLHQKGERDHA